MVRYRGFHEYLGRCGGRQVGSRLKYSLGFARASKSPRVELAAIWDAPRNTAYIEARDPGVDCVGELST